MKEEERVGSSSSSSSSLPVSYGVDSEKYEFSSSLSQPQGSSNKSRVFSLDNNNSNTISMFPRDRPCSCLHHLFKWILLRCCGCLS